MYTCYANANAWSVAWCADALLAWRLCVQCGSIEVDGVPLNSVHVDSLRRLMGVVSQEPVLFNMTVRDNIAAGRSDATVTDAEVETAATSAAAADFINALPEGFHTEVGDRGVKLSGGQKQRIAVARYTALVVS